MREARAAAGGVVLGAGVGWLVGGSIMHLALDLPWQGTATEMAAVVAGAAWGLMMWMCRK